MDTHVFTFGSLVYLYLKTKPKNRKHWVHPINSERHTSRHYVQLYKKLRQDPVKFYFRMTISSFDELLSYIECDIQRQNTNMRSAIGPEEMLVITLR